MGKGSVAEMHHPVNGKYINSRYVNMYMMAIIFTSDHAIMYTNYADATAHTRIQ